jgi:hypothetical protein
MPVLSPNKAVRSAKPQILVENPLEPGRYHFQLIVVDDANNASAPAELVVQVVRRTIGPIDLGGLARPDRIGRPILNPRNPSIIIPGRITRPGG